MVFPSPKRFWILLLKPYHFRTSKDGSAAIEYSDSIKSIVYAGETFFVDFSLYKAANKLWRLNP